MKPERFIGVRPKDGLLDSGLLTVGGDDSRILILKTVSGYFGVSVLVEKRGGH